MQTSEYGQCPICGGAAMFDIDCNTGKVVGYFCMEGGEEHEPELTAEELAVLGVEDANDMVDGEVKK